jgi:polysaccharide export outer membrane protein
MIDRKREETLGFHSTHGSSPGVWNIRARSNVGLLAIVMMLVSLGCTTLSPPPPSGPPSPYIVGAPDQLSVRILPDPEVILEVTVRPDGMISVPLIGDVAAGGRTIPQISSDIQTKMGKFKRGAQATVMLVAAAHTDVTVFGEVVKSASFSLVKDTRVVEALAYVGGPTTFAWNGRIRVIRSLDGETVVHRVDLTDIREGDLSTNLLLEPGDIVYVPPTILARIGYAIQAVLFPFQPLLGLARTGAAGFIP